MEPYDIEEAFKKIEHELMASMVRNLSRHRAEETDLGINWSMWQVEQLKALDRYKKTNAKKFSKTFKSINQSIPALISAARAEGGTSQEVAILNAIKEGFKGARKTKGTVQTAASFFRMNTRRMDALIKATTNDLQKAEHAMLRMANDKYRQIIFNAEAYAASGAATYEKAVDMATKDYLSAGINCVEYANGARHTLQDYSSMAIKTASKRAYLTGEGEKRKEWGLSLVIMNKRGNPCPKCLPFVGKVLIDDVWSGGDAKDGDYPLMSRAMELGLYHPRCKDGHTTYFDGLTEKPDDQFTRQELEDIEENYREEQKRGYARRQVERFTRLRDGSLDPENKKKYATKVTEWENMAESLEFVAKSDNSDTIIAGAISGARNPYGKAASKHADTYYGLVRSMKTDVEKIAKVTGYSEEQIQEVKNFVFLEKHDLGGNNPEYFKPDYMMGESWRRLTEGTPEPHDYTLLKHEMMERDLVKQGHSQEEAHFLTSQKYNYDKEATEFYGKIKKYRKE